MVGYRCFSLKSISVFWVLAIFLFGVATSAHAGGNTSDGTVPYEIYEDKYKAPIVTFLVVIVGVEAIKAGIATFVPGGSTAVAVEGAVETVVIAGILYSMGLKEEAVNELANTSITAVAGKAVHSSAPISSYISLGMSIEALAEELSR